MCRQELHPQHLSEPWSHPMPHRCGHDGRKQGHWWGCSQRRHCGVGTALVGQGQEPGVAASKARYSAQLPKELCWKVSVPGKCQPVPHCLALGQWLQCVQLGQTPHSAHCRPLLLQLSRVCSMEGRTLPLEQRIRHLGRKGTCQAS